MGNPGSIEKVMVFGILVIILGILGIAIWSRNDSNEPNVSAFGSEDGNVPLKPLVPPSGSDDPGVENGNANAFVERPNQDPVSEVPDVDKIAWDDNAVPIDPGVEEPAPAPIVKDEPKPAVEPDPPAPTTYTVKSGDTLEKIARDVLGDRKYVGDIQKANPGLNPQRIFVGQVLKLPSVGDSGASPVSQKAVEKTTASETKPKAEPAKPNPVPMTHTIQPGDNLAKISRKYYGNVDMVIPIAKANKDVIKDRNNLPVGKTIKLPNP